ncbi:MULTISPECIES: helix-turn-helix domain-containing protein [Streptococcus]|uniref:Repressor protein C2 n=2 Tax=Streptococcus dysgalactiae TaxID=1334 RepID=A0AB33R6U8_STREQ|nr:MULTISPECIES: helix-turn-helix transcriptional regulator [Streptococcus]KKC17041.1 Cro/Cl family transcriptional regulator [Streptococcus dysgalactiae subsp. equisimilis]OBY98777.1 transcriptional regulator [Streptococcus dysgalactiae subsp. equisimilis]OBZ01295.1 transcriptional regulator [Streptococcus dysgalactiae subsp. equisimilis]OCX08158.1 transcriptional regulator [Streptococcus dysgalactiae subsp. equisimilis AKSDE4288]QJD62345.1 helix-turn-helix transcriptional regulator [Streptoc
MEKLGDRLRKQRQLNKLTQQELADRIGINRGAYSNWENGKREPSFSKLIELSKLLNTTPNYLLGISDA